MTLESHTLRGTKQRNHPRSGLHPVRKYIHCIASTTQDTNTRKESSTSNVHTSQSKLGCQNDVVHPQDRSVQIASHTTRGILQRNHAGIGPAPIRGDIPCHYHHNTTRTKTRKECSTFDAPVFKASWVSEKMLLNSWIGEDRMQATSQMESSIGNILDLVSPNQSIDALFPLPHTHTHHTQLRAPHWRYAVLAARRALPYMWVTSRTGE